MAKVTVSLTLEQATHLRGLVAESLDLHRTVLLDPGLISERARTEKGPEHEKQLAREYDLLDGILRELS